MLFRTLKGFSSNTYICNKWNYLGVSHEYSPGHRRRPVWLLSKPRSYLELALSFGCDGPYILLTQSMEATFSLQESSPRAISDPLRNLVKSDSVDANKKIRSHFDRGFSGLPPRLVRPSALQVVPVWSIPYKNGRVYLPWRVNRSVSKNWRWLFVKRLTPVLMIAGHHLLPSPSDDHFPIRGLLRKWTCAQCDAAHIPWTLGMHWYWLIWRSADRDNRSLKVCHLLLPRSCTTACWASSRENLRFSASKSEFVGEGELVADMENVNGNAKEKESMLSPFERHLPFYGREMWMRRSESSIGDKTLPRSIVRRNECSHAK